MDITPYVDSLRRDLLAAADAAGAEGRAVAERLGYALDPAVRLAVMEALSQAAAEITAAMPQGGVDVRLDGRDLAFVVDAGVPDATEEPPAPAPPAPDPAAEDEGLARVSLRLPESLKARADDAAAQAGQSLNTWLVNLIRAATSGGLPGALPGVPSADRPGHRRMTGWL